MKTARTDGWLESAATVVVRSGSVVSTFCSSLRGATASESLTSTSGLVASFSALSNTSPLPRTLPSAPSRVTPCCVVSGSDQLTAQHTISEKSASAGTFRVWANECCSARGKRSAHTHRTSVRRAPRESCASMSSCTPAHGFVKVSSCRSHLIRPIPPWTQRIQRSTTAAGESHWNVSFIAL